MATEPQSPRDESLTASLHRLADSVLGSLSTRLEILSTELGEERLNLTTLALVALTVLFCLQVGLIFAILFLVLVVARSTGRSRWGSRRWSCCSGRVSARCGFAGG